MRTLALWCLVVWHLPKAIANASGAMSQQQWQEYQDCHNRRRSRSMFIAFHCFPAIREEHAYALMASIEAPSRLSCSKHPDNNSLAQPRATARPSKPCAGACKPSRRQSARHRVEPIFSRKGRCCRMRLHVGMRTSPDVLHNDTCRSNDQTTQVAISPTVYYSIPQTAS